jgi:uncharacterized protein YgbK (DUF1537 family)
MPDANSSPFMTTSSGWALRSHDSVTSTEAIETATALAQRVNNARRRTAFASIVILGGDTAAAVLGNEPRRIGGTVGLGMPWTVEGDTTIVTRPGGFGDEQSLVRLFSARMEP